MKLKLALLALAGLTASGAAAAEAGVCARTAEAGAAVRAARAELVAIPLEEDETLVPPATSRLIERVKDRLRAFVRAEMACAPASPDPAALAAAMAARGDAFVDTAPYDPEHPAPDRHGNFLAYEVSRVESQPDMLAVVARLGIHCGTDSILLLYRRDPGGGWRELMVRRAEPYSEVKGGWADLRFAVSPKDAQGGWYVATVSITPWCTSAWQGMPFELARPGSAADRPTVFFKARNGTYLGNEGDMTVSAEADAFEIRHDGSSLDPGILIRRHVRRYSVAGESVRRIQPVAENVRDFVDEWIASPWAEAKAWSAGDPALARIHARLEAGRYALLGEFGSVRACGDGITQVEMNNERGPGWFFFAKGGESGPWILERVGRRAEAACAGPDLLKREGG
jgi:hypothetical protein